MKNLFADEIANLMEKEFQRMTKVASVNLNGAISYLHSAAEIFENVGMTKQADQILNILEKFANEDYHTKDLTSDKMIKNLLNHGTEFNLVDDNLADDLLDLNLSDDELYVLEGEALDEIGFEDEL